MYISSDIANDSNPMQTNDFITTRFKYFQDYEETLPPPIALIFGTAYISLLEPYEKEIDTFL